MRVALLTITAVLSGCFGDVTDLGQAAPDAKTVDVKAILSQWSGCMTMTNFQAANMTQAWSTLATTTDSKQCINCHDGGQFGFMATDDETAFFSGISQHSGLMAMYFTVDFETEQVTVNTSSFASANGKLGHPKFNATENAGMTALQSFYSMTASNTVCETTKMID